MSLIGTAAVSSGINVLGGLGNQLISAGLQKSMLRNQYDAYFRAARRAGATPSAIAQGLTGSGPSQTPSVSAGAPLPDFASNLTSAADVASQNQSRDVDRQNTILEMHWKPARWFADINRTFSEVRKNLASAGLDKKMISYYDELEKSVRLKRPWEIRTMRQGLLNMAQELTNLKQKHTNMQTENSMMQSQTRMYDSQTDLNYNMSMNQGQQGYALMFENQLRASGWNPNEAPWPNIIRLSATNPGAASRFLDTTAETLGILDNKLKEGLGEHYKRNLGLVAAMHFVNERLGRHQYNKSVRFDNFTRGLHNLYPFTSGSTPPAIQGFRR